MFTPLWHSQPLKLLPPLEYSKPSFPYPSTPSYLNSLSPGFGILMPVLMVILKWKKTEPELTAAEPYPHYLDLGAAPLLEQVDPKVQNWYRWIYQDYSAELSEHWQKHLCHRGDARSFYSLEQDVHHFAQEVKKASRRFINKQQAAFSGIRMGRC